MTNNLISYLILGIRWRREVGIECLVQVLPEYDLDLVLEHPVGQVLPSQVEVPLLLVQHQRQALLKHLQLVAALD